MKSLFRSTCAGIVLLFLCNNSVLAESFVYDIHSDSFSSFQIPGVNALLTGINDAGRVIGDYSSSPGGFYNGFLYDGTTFTSIQYPGAYDTTVNGINNAGQIVGQQASPLPPGGLAFLKDGNSFTSFNYPGAMFTYGNGINDRGQIVGAYRVETVVGPNSVQDFDHGLLINGNTLTSFDVPGARNTSGAGINNAGMIVGSYYDGTTHGFLMNGNTFTSIDVPGATFTAARALNDLSQILGSYDDSNHKAHGFLYAGNTFTLLPDFPRPDGVAFMAYTGINNVGQIVGYYEPLPHIPEPSSFLLLAVGLAGLEWWRRKQPAH